MRWTQTVDQRQIFVRFVPFVTNFPVKKAGSGA